MNNEEQPFLTKLDARLWNAADHLRSDDEVRESARQRTATRKNWLAWVGRS